MTAVLEIGLRRFDITGDEDHLAAALVASTAPSDVRSKRLLAVTADVLAEIGFARGFDGCKAHIAIDPDSETITATSVTRATPAPPDPPRN